MSKVSLEVLFDNDLNDKINSVVKHGNGEFTAGEFVSGVISAFLEKNYSDLVPVEEEVDLFAFGGELTSDSEFDPTSSAANVSIQVPSLKKKPTIKVVS